MNTQFALVLGVSALAWGCFDIALLPESDFLLPQQSPTAAVSGQRCGDVGPVVDAASGWPSASSVSKGDDRLYAHQYDPLGRGGSAIIRVDPDTGERETVTPVRGFPAPFAISPDGRWIAYTQEPAKVPMDLTVAPMELEIVASDGSSTVHVHSSDMPISGLSWSPDSLDLAFITDNSVWRHESVKKESTPISEVRGDAMGRYHQAAWSPAGDWILHSAFTYHRMARVKPDGSDRRLVAMAHDFSWSPDGSVFALADASGLALVDADFASMSYALVGLAVAVTWSPVGDAVAFYGDNGYSEGPLCVLDNRGSLRELAPCTDTGWESIAWSPDSTRLVFTEMVSPGECRRTADQRLAVIDISEGTISPLGEDVVFPVWFARPEYASENSLAAE